MKELGIATDFGPNLEAALYNELINIQLRFGDAIIHAEEEHDHAR